MTAEKPPQRSGDSLGVYLRSLRDGTNLTLRDVEEATNKEVSNAYLSQLEHGKISKPSPNVLHALSKVYRVSYEKLMQRAGYITPQSEREDHQKHGRAATFAIENLTREEEDELLKYLSFVRQQGKK